MTVENSLYPVFLQLRDRKVVVIGGGPVAERKVRALMAARARVHLVAPAITPALIEWSDTDQLTWHPKAFDTAVLEGAWLVVAATDDTRVNRHVRDEAEQRNIWVNVVDDPELSAFHVPAVVDRAPITIAISSGGYAPVLARRLRERFESLVDHSIGALASLLAKRRQSIQHAFPDLAQRRRFYEWALDGPAAALLRQGQLTAAETEIDQALALPTEWPRNGLTVLRAPGEDPGLLTLKGLRALHEADAIMFDPERHSEAVLSMARRDAERISKGLAARLRAVSTRDIATNELADIIRTHGRVVLLVSERDFRSESEYDAQKEYDVLKEHDVLKKYDALKECDPLRAQFQKLESAGITVEYL